MRSTLAVLLGLIVAATATLAKQTKQADIDLQAATRTETVKGDLKAAIKQYEAIVATYAKDRAITAQALVRMAECYQKMGDAESRKLYEQVLRDYSDQKEAVAVARLRLGSNGVSGMISREVWPRATAPTSRDMYGTMSLDGRLLPFVDWSREGNLFLHDLVTGSDRQITDQGNSRKDIYAENFSFSQDGKLLVYSWHTEERYQLRVVGLQGSGIPQNRVLVDNPDVVWIVPHDWTPDGKWITVTLTRKDRSAQIGLVSTADGSLRVLKSVDWRLPNQMFLSPDAKYLAFDTPANDTTEQRDIFLLAIDGSNEQPAVVHPAEDRVMGWSADNNYLVFLSDRSGSLDLWALRVNNGKPQGQPEHIKSNVGQVLPLGVSRSGALYFWTIPGPFSPNTIQLASFDFNANRFTSEPVAIAPRGSEAPVWSPDGKYLAYQSVRQDESSLLVIRSTDTGQSRDLHPQMRLRGPAHWSPDGRFLVAGGRDFKGRMGVHMIDVQTGQVSPVVTEEDNGDPFNGARPEFSVDGKRVYYKKLDRATGEIRFVARDLASGDERNLIGSKTYLRADGTQDRLGDFNQSPDGRFLVTIVPLDTAFGRALVLIPTSGGEPRELMQVKNSDRLTAQMWSPDSQSIFVTKATNGQRQLLRISLNGEVHTLDVDVEKYKFMLPNSAWAVVHPDGHRIAYLSNTGSGEARAKTEVWVMENFLPTAKSTK
jgi:Tol biopolymer transport system component